MKDNQIITYTKGQQNCFIMDLAPPGQVILVKTKIMAIIR